MNISKEEKQVLKGLVERELKEFKSEEKVIRDTLPAFIASEEKYEEFLKELMEKLK